MVKNVTREELPQFNSHDEAKAYFDQKYGASNFQLVEEINDKSEGIFFLYKLILDPEVYKNGLEVIKEKGYFNDQAFIQSTQRIKIMANGEVHI